MIKILFLESLSKGVTLHQGFDKPVLSEVEGLSPNGLLLYFGGIIGNNK